jgi:hypothetical protein
MRIGDSWKRRLNITGSWKMSVIAVFAALRPPMCCHDTVEELADEDEEEEEEEEGGCSFAMETTSSAVV